MSYAEREPARLAGADLWLASLGYRLHRLLGRRLEADAAALEVARRARRLDADARRSLAPLRYELRREGGRSDALLDAFALYCAVSGSEPSPAALAAAAWMTRGGIAELAAPAEREQALGLAAFAAALRGPAVHVLAGSDAAAKAIAARLDPPFAAAGLGVGLVESRMDGAARRRVYVQPLVCVSHREAGLDYLRDCAARGGRPGVLHGLEEGRERLLLPGLHCALVAEADAVMLDDARAPLVIARDAEPSGERLVYEQAMELARALKPGEDFTLAPEEPLLSEPAAALLERLVRPLGGVWAAREAREALVRLALEALHALERGADYRVEQGRIVLPERAREEAEDPHTEALKAMLEVKEGCRTGERKQVVGRLTVPEFLGRYRRLAGLCADARGLEDDFWALYRMKTARAGARAQRRAARTRVFVTAAAKQRALAEAGEGALVVLRKTYPGAGDSPASEVVIAELLDSRRHVAALLASHAERPVSLLVSLEDERMVSALPGFALKAARMLARSRDPLPDWAGASLVWLAQRRVEREQTLARLELLSRQQMMNDLLAFAGRGE